MAKSGTATFLFTDLEGSTRLWEEQEAAMQPALARHDELVRSAVESNGGEVVKTTGDGVHAAFDRAEDAITAAAAIQRAISAEEWGDSRPLTVRIGIHTGAAEARGGDYYGTAVNRAARLTAIAHGGQILVSRATEVLTHDSLPRDLSLRDLGEHRLRDLTRAERVFQLVGAGLRDDFPRLQSLEAQPSHLPVQLTIFIGRREERIAIAALVHEHRLVTIIGVGGVGKTRLALEVAAEVLPGLRDGAWCCELASATDEESMVDIVAGTLGVVDHPGVTRRESVLEYLASKEMLLVLDNCEHLLDPVAELASDVLVRGNDVRILATSREPLSIPGEHVWGLRSLPVPAGTELHELEASDAVRLFVERAQAIRPEFVLDEGNAAAVADICRRLDGIPLAIELAAARVLTLQPAEIAARLDERFRLLSAGRRASVERHQTLQATVDWSYSLLTDAERLAFTRLAVFPASFDADAAEAVAAGGELEGWDVIDALASLVTKSMMSSEDAGDGTTRFAMLETLRQYGRDRLRELGGEEIDLRQRRHATHYAHLAAELGPRLATSDELPASRRVGAEIENFRSAIAWGLEQSEEDDRQLAVRIAGSLTLIVSTKRSLGFGAYAERCATAALAAPPGLRFCVLGGAAFSAVQRNDLDRARQLTAAAFVDGPPEDAVTYSTTYTARAISHLATDITESLRVMQEGADIAGRFGDEFAHAVLRSNVGAFSALAGDEETGLVAGEEGLARARRLGNPTAIAICGYIWAIARWLDDPAGARVALEEVMELIASGASDIIQADALELLARLDSQDDDVLGAVTDLRVAMYSSRAVGNRISMASHVSYAAEILGAAGIEPELVGVLEGMATRSEALSMMMVGGREGALHEAAVTAARASVGDARFDALVEQGGAMSYDEIVAYVTRELDRIIDELAES